MNVAYVTPEDFERFRTVQQPRHGSHKSSCCKMLMLIVIVAIVAIVMTSPFCQKKLRDVPMYISGLKTVLKNQAVSVKNVMVAPPPDDKYVATISPTCHNLTPCNPEDGKCNDFKQVDATFKTQTTATVRDFLQAHPNLLMLVYAPWCPHCHTALPEFMKASESVDKNISPCILNAEMVDSNVLMEMQVTHFPFIVRSNAGHTNVFQGNPSSQAIVEFANNM